MTQSASPTGRRRSEPNLQWAHKHTPQVTLSVPLLIDIDYSAIEQRLMEHYKRNKLKPELPTTMVDLIDTVEVEATEEMEDDFDDDDEDDDDLDDEEEDDDDDFEAEFGDDDLDDDDDDIFYDDDDD